MPVTIFFCYAHEDEAFLDKLKTQLSPLQWQGLIDPWYDRDISAGTEWEEEIKEHLNTAQIIILLVSPDFMASKYCYGVEMKRAVERHEHKEARVIPVILRPIYWQSASFGKLQALPKDAKPVKSWPDPDQAFFNVAEGIRKVVEEITTKLSPLSQALPIQQAKPEPTPPLANMHKQQPVQPEPLVTPEDFSWHCICTLTGHENIVHSVAINPDGQTLASGSGDKTIKLWEKQ